MYEIRVTHAVTRIFLCVNFVDLGLFSDFYQSQYISAFRSYLVVLYSYNVSDFCSIAQFRIFSLPSDILNVISTPHLQAATLHYSTHP